MKSLPKGISNLTQIIINPMNEDKDFDGIELPDPNLLNEDELLIAIDTLVVEAGTNLTLRGNAINQVCEMIFKIDDPVRQAVFVNEVSKRHKIPKKVMNDKLKTLKDSMAMIIQDKKDPLDDFEGIDKFAARKIGFFEHRHCYYFITNGNLLKASNFVIRPLYHIYSKTDNKRLIELVNEAGSRKILDIQSKNLISIDLFKQVVFSEGHFLFFGTNIHLMRVIDNIASQFPICNELKTLGWQREGFYAFANGIYNGTWLPIDKFGITSHGKQKYFSPAFSIINSETREDDDEFESDRHFVWKPSPVTFGQWTRLIMDVYGQKGRIAIAFVIATVFRDLIYEKYKIFPHLFLFGEKQSGKSQLAWSLSNLFFDNMPAFNLSSGTQVGFHRRLSRIKNAICWWDEYSNEIDPKRIQTLKSAYDGMGHEKGKMTRDNRTEVTKVNSSSLISGQYLPTADDNALFTRSILLLFERKIYSMEEVQRYDELKTVEQAGLSSLVGDVLKFRKEMEATYCTVFSMLMDKVKSELTQKGKQFDERLVRNFCTILAPAKIILESLMPLELNFTFEEIYEQSLVMIADLSKQITSSESLSNFWMMVEYLLDNKQIEATKDFEVKTVAMLKVTTREGLGETLTYPVPKMVLFIRFSKIHPLYMEGHRRQFGKNGVDLVSLMHYIKNHSSYIGHVSSYRFEDSVSTCYAFDYEDLRVNLERSQRKADGDDQPF
jgi:DNA primase